MGVLLQLIRFRNLLIILLTQALIFFGLFLPVLKKHHLSIPSYYADFLLLYGFTALIAAGGYLINDLMDTGPDSFNKPEKLIVGKSLSKKNTLQLYYFSLLSGFLLGVLIDIFDQRICFVLIQPILSTGLAFYSLKLKGIPLLGNILIAILSALVPGIFLIFFQNEISGLEDPDKSILVRWIIAYSIFAFISSLLREIVKDMEDMEGDKSFGINSTAVAFGIPKSKRIAVVTSVLLCISLIIWAMMSFNGNMVLWTYPLILIITLVRLTKRLSLSQEKTDFAGVSRGIKYFMLAGLIYILIFSLIHFNK